MTNRIASLALVLSLSASAAAQGQALDKGALTEETAPKDAAIASGVAYLVGSQAEDGHWGQQYSVAITGMAGLALLATSDAPRMTPHTAQAVRWLSAQVKDGRLPKQGHTWVHGQGFATLFLAEAYGRAKQGENEHDLDLEALKGIVAACVKALEAAQSTTGGWNYDAIQGDHGHEGSTTVCAVQALASALRQGVEIDATVLERGFQYLKQTQNEDGGFRYQMTPGASMNEGTAAAVATLALMRKLDYPVLFRGAERLKQVGPDSITNGRFPYYGHFYSVLGMNQVHAEMGEGVPHAEGWHLPVEAWLLKTQQQDGAWPMLGWMTGSGGEGEKRDYPTALALLTLSVHAGRVSIFKR